MANKSKDEHCLTHMLARADGSASVITKRPACVGLNLAATLDSAVVHGHGSGAAALEHPVQHEERSGGAAVNDQALPERGAVRAGAGQWRRGRDRWAGGAPSCRGAQGLTVAWHGAAFLPGQAPRRRVGADG